MKRESSVPIFAWGAGALLIVGLLDHYGMTHVSSAWGYLALWGSAGLLIGLVLIAPARARWSIALSGAAASLVNILMHGGAHEGRRVLEIVTAPVSPLMCLALGVATHRLCRGTPRLQRVRDVATVLLVCGLGGGVLAALWVYASGLIAYPGLPAVSLAIMFSMGCMGSMILPPLVIAVGEVFRGGVRGLRRTPTDYVTNLGAMALMVVVCFFVFRERVTDWRAVALPLLPFGVLAITAFLVGPRTTTIATAIMGVFVTVLTNKGLGPFAAILPNIADQLIAGNVFVTLSSATAMLIASAMSERWRLAAEIEAARQRLELAVVGSNVGIWDWNILTGRAQWGGGVPHVLGDGEEADNPDFWKDRLHPDDSERVMAQLQAHLERSEVYDTEYRLRTRDGSYRWFGSRGRAVRDRAGRAVRMCGTISDIDARVAAEARLRESEARFRQLTELSQDLIIHVARDGRRLYRSPAAQRLFGFDAREQASTDLTLRVHPDDRAQSLRVHEAALRGEKSRVEVRGIDADGNVHHLDMFVEPVGAESGIVESYICYGRDITDLKAAEAKARQAEERYRAFVTQSAEAIWRFDLDQPIETGLGVEEQVELIYRHGALAECNDAMAAMYGYSAAKDLLGARLGDLLPRDDPKNREYVADCVRSGYRLVDRESNEIDREGRPRVFLNNLFGIVEGGRLTRAWGTQRDVTAQREAERLRDEQNTILESIASSATLQDVLDEIVWSVQRQSSGVTGSIILLDSDGQTMRSTSGPDLPKEYCDAITGMKIGPGVGSCGRCMFIRTGVVVSDIASDPLWEGICDLALRHGLRACWSEPIIGSDGHVLGSFAMYYRSVRTPNEWEKQLISSIARVAAIAIERKQSEQAIRQSQAANAALIGAIPDLLFRVNREGRYLDYAGPEGAPLWVPREQFIGRTVADVMPPVRAEQCMLHLNAAFKTGQTQTYDYESATPHEPPRSWEVRVVKASEDEALLLVRNVTDRRRAEIALRDAEERYRSLVERLPLVVYTAPIGDSEPTYVSPQFRDITGLAPERLLGGRELYEKHIHPDDRARVAGMLARADRAGGGGGGSVEYRLIRPDGREVWLREQVVAARDGKGRPVSIHGLVLDITAAKRAEEALRDNQSRLALLLSQAPFAVIVWNTRYEITQWNPAAERVFGYSAEEAIGRNAEIIVPPSAKSYADGVWRQLLSRRGGSHAVNENVNKHGKSIICEWNNSPLLGPDGGVVGVSSFVQDVTERVNSERRQALMMRELDHRVKNNMAAVLSLAEQTGRTAGSFEQFHATFTGRVRALARLHTALASSRWNGADLREILQQAVEPYSGDDDARLSLDGPAVLLPPRVAQSLTMAFNELATNAFKYGALSRPGGCVRVDWSVSDPETPGGPPASLAVSWQERGGPCVSFPDRRGFGMDLIEGAITYQLRGSVTFDFSAEGLSCRLLAPLGLDEATPHVPDQRFPAPLAENPR